MFVVMGATGNTGKVVASTLLAAGKRVRVVVHSTATEHAWRDKGVEVAIADLEDRPALERALRGAEGAYVMFPPAFHSTQVRVDNDRRAKNLAAAITAADVAHTVMLSSIGAQHAEGTGPVLYLHDAEATLAATLAGRRSGAVTLLRAAYFMENWASALSTIDQGILPTFLLADRAIPMVATRDIGVAAARLLVEGGNGKRIVQLAGPRECAPRDVAAALARVVGRDLAVQQFPDEAMAGALLGTGMSPEWSRLFAELTRGINVGRVAWETAQPIVRGETDLDAVLAGLVRR